MPALQCIGAVHTRFETSKGLTDEWHYYISSKVLSAEELLYHARAYMVDGNDALAFGCAF